ncbi:MAG TPA: UDP-N-acetylmuramoyl-L-alanine--D-glutamate ligase, partial [Candidatus Saccharimonadaceae bacterium]|nr:UDP-N-acetylmuramoyl-L-alanine--D-glutamate ligase [Candidatus Saccharimonadaceae bacterium]
VAIAGYGVEGRENFKYWQNLGAELTIADERTTVADLPEGIPTILGENAFQKLDGFDLVIRTAGLAPRKIKTNGKIWSATNEFLAKCPAVVIGVTGSKGKGTTCSLIAAILRAGGYSVHLVGNIGVPALEVLERIQPDDIVVYEMSSFQLWDVEKSPHIAVLLGIEPDHLDVHASMDEYVAAKANITRFQAADDELIFNRDNQYTRAITERSLAQKIAYPYDITNVSASLRIPGQHNVENASAAIAAVRDYVTDPEVIRRGLASFTGLPHRLKFVAEKNGVKYYDDSIGTTPGSTIAAIHSFSEPKVLILGGHDKGADFQPLVDAVIAEPAMRAVLTIGETGDRIADLFNQAGSKSLVQRHSDLKTMTEIVAVAYN